MNADRHGEIDTWAPRRITDAWWVRPSTVVFSLAGVLAGTAAAIYGTETSKAFSNFGGGLTIRVMGVLMVLGGVLALAGIARADRLVEGIGHIFTGTGVVIYAFGVILGLGLAGVIAGTGYTAIAACLISRVLVILRPGRRSGEHG